MLNNKNVLTMLVALAIAGGVNPAYAQNNPQVNPSASGTPQGATIANGTQSTAQQQSTIANTVEFPSGGPSDVTYHGNYTVKSAPTVYAPALTASITETCWGSVSGGVSGIGFGVTLGGTIKDYDCNRRLDASVAGRMGRMDIAFALMCQSDDFRAAAATTDKPCPSGIPEGKQGTEIIPGDPKVGSTLKTDQKQYATADTSGNQPKP